MKLRGTFTLPNASLSLYRIGYGAMQLAGPGVWGLRLIGVPRRYVKVVFKILV
jgi:hypothetical protein